MYSVYFTKQEAKKACDGIIGGKLEEHATNIFTKELAKSTLKRYIKELVKFIRALDYKLMINKEDVNTYVRDYG